MIKMAYIKICDLCGKPIQGEPQKNYKIKERWSSWWESGWVPIDAHEECVKKLFDAARNKTEE